MSVMVIACYRPKPGCEDDLDELMAEHLPTLHREGLVEEGSPSLCGRAPDGTVVEVFCWKSQEAIDEAHGNAAVAAMWERYARVAEYVPIARVAGAQDLFTALEPLGSRRP